MRRSAIADLLASSGVLLEDLAHLFRLQGTPEAADGGQYGRTQGRRVESLLKVAAGRCHAVRHGAAACLLFQQPDLLPPPFGLPLQDA